MKISNQRLVIGIPCSFPMVPISFVYSLLYMDRPNYVLVHADNGPIDTLRNDIVRKAQSLNATKLLMVDTDMVYHPQTVTSLLSRNLKMVAGLSFRRYPPFDSIMLKLTGTGYESINEWEEGALVEVDATGAACMMYDMEVFRKLPDPWFKFRTNPQNGLTIGEDIGFCQAAKAAGYQIFIDTTVPSDHLTTMAVNRNTNKLFESMKERQFDALNRALGEQQTLS